MRAARRLLSRLACAFLVAGSGGLEGQSLPAAGAEGSAPPQAAARLRVSGRFGVEAEVLSSFSEAIRPKDGGSARPESPSGDLIALLEDTVESRSELLRQLTARGRPALGEDLFRALFERRLDLNQRIPLSRESMRTLALLAWLEDLTRASLHESGLPSAWYDRRSGFLPSSSHAEFSFEDGDILLVTGGSSISALITQATQPQRKFSHALIVRLQDGRWSTLETLIETGAVSRSSEEISRLSLQAVQVLRWRNPEERPTIARQASEVGASYVDRRVPYDSEIDLADSSRLFCSELVARAYAEASGLPVEDMVPELARVRSEAVQRYLRNLGLRNPVMVSPGDLTASSCFEVVAEYRKSEDLAHLWKMMITADVFIERLERGYVFRPWLGADLVATLAGFGDFFLGVPRRLLGVDLALIPASLDRRAVATLMTQEKTLFRRARKRAEALSATGSEPTLFDLCLFGYWSEVSQAMEEDRVLRRVLSPDRARPEGGGATGSRRQR